MNEEKKRLTLLAVIAGMLTVSSFCFAALWEYENKPGSLGTLAKSWPKHTALGDASPGIPLLFLHPKCPCSLASIQEFERILQKSQHKGKVIFWIPNDDSASDPSWTETPLTQIAKNNTRIETHLDPGGKICVEFGVETSGHCLAYSTDGSLCYSGGITIARGHQGPNNGAIAMEKLLTSKNHTTVKLLSYPVYGCSIF